MWGYVFQLTLSSIPLNTEKALRERLLGMIPIAELKNKCQVVGIKRDVVADQASRLTTKQTWLLTFELFTNLKQHTYVYDHNLKSVPTLTNSVIQSADFVGHGNAQNSLHLDHIVPITFTVQALDLKQYVASDHDIKFFWPVRVTFEPARLVVSIGILEKNMGTYLGAGYRVITSRRSKD